MSVSITRLLRMGSLAAAFCIGSASVVASPNHQCSDDAMLVFDGSGSMAEMGYNGLDRPRIVDAREAMHRVMPRVTPFRKVGLIIYGPGPKDACSNIDLRFAPLNDAAPLIIDEVEDLSPAGKTPLTQAVRDAAETLNYREKSGVVVLVTDGKETCGGATCQLAARLATKAENLTVHVIGFKVRGDFFKWNSQKTNEEEEPEAIASCLADQTGGKYFSTESTDELVAALQETLSCPLIGGNKSQPAQRIRG